MGRGDIGGAAHLQKHHDDGEPRDGTEVPVVPHFHGNGPTPFMVIVSRAFAMDHPSAYLVA